MDMGGVLAVLDDIAAPWGLLIEFPAMTAVAFVTSTAARQPTPPPLMQIKITPFVFCSTPACLTAVWTARIPFDLPLSRGARR